MWNWLNVALFVFTGDLSCGKTTLIAKLQGNEEPEKGSGLEFTHLTVSDDYREGKLCLLSIISSPIIQYKSMVSSDVSPGSLSDL